VLTFVNGLVAPSFLFCAGFALAISLRRRWPQFIGLGRPFWRYLLRLLFVFVVGYSLHLPFFSLRRLGAIADPNVWVSFYQVDILQVIAVTLIALVFLAAAIREQQAFRLVVTLVALALVFATPVIRAMDFTAYPIWLRPYFSAQFKSQFPLLPWAAFLMSGAMIGFWFMEASEKGQGDVWMKRLALLAGGGIAASIAVELIPYSVYPNHDFWKVSPEFFFVRLGCVALAMAALWKLGARKTTPSLSPVTPGRGSTAPSSSLSKPGRGSIAPSSSLIALFGQESLLVYVVHLLIVYGYTYEFSFVRKFGPTLDYWQCLGLFAVLSIGMYILAYVWHRLKTWNMRVAYAVQVSVLGGTVAAFLMQ
jgi:hypothetical protein